MASIDLEPDTIQKLRAELDIDSLARRFFLMNKSTRFHYRAKLLHAGSVVHVIFTCKRTGDGVEVRKVRTILKRNGLPDYGFTLNDNHISIGNEKESQAAATIAETLDAARRSGVKGLLVARSA